MTMPRKIIGAIVEATIVGALFGPIGLAVWILLIIGLAAIGA